MRAIFSIVSLLVVLALVGMLAKKQLGSVSAGAAPVNFAVQDPAVSVPVASPGATPQAQSLQIQQQVKQQLESLQKVRPVPDEQ